VREKQAAVCLESAIASLLSGSVSPDLVEARDEDLRGRVQVAKRLAALDLVGESRVRESLRERLELAMELAQGRAAEPAVRRAWALRRPILATELAVLLIVTLLAVVAPRSLAALVEPVVRIIEMVRVGDHTLLLRSALQTGAEVAATREESRRKLASGQSWFLSTPYGGFGGAVPPGTSARVLRVSSLQRLRSLTAMRIQVPTGVHRDEPVRFDHAFVAPGGIVLIFLGSGANEVLLAEFPVGKGQSVGIGRMTNRTAPDGSTVFESPELKTEELSLSGQTVVWDPDPEPSPRSPHRSESSGLHWEEHGVSCSLMGRSLTREEAVDLFLSRRPLGEVD
jgi:hypothetical protein